MMKLTKHTIFVPLTLALAVSQVLHAEPARTAVGVKDEIASVAVKPKFDRYSSPMYQIERDEDGNRVLDMTDPVHYQWAKKRLLSAGKDEIDYPQLHKSLDELKSQQIKAKKTGVVAKATIPEGSDIIENAHMFLDLQVAVNPLDEKAYLIVRAESSVYGGTTSTYVDLVLEDNQGNTIAPIGATFEVLEGEKTHAVSSVTLDLLRERYPNLTTIYASSWVETEDANGNITSGLRFTEYPWDWEAIDEKYGPKALEQGDKAVSRRPTHYTATAPIDTNTDGVVKVCLNRNHADCDYAADQYQDPNSITNVNIPFQGQVELPHRILHVYGPNEPKPESIDEVTNIFLQEGIYGGATKQTFKDLQNNKNKTFYDYIELGDPDKLKRTTIVKWNIEREEGRFGNAMLFSNIAEADWRINLIVNGYPYFRGRPSDKPQDFHIQINSNNIDGLKNFFVEALPKIKLGYSCLAKGTMITMADGSQRPIELISKGDYVMGAKAENNRSVEAMRVVDVSIGVEALKMFRIIGADGNDVLMTETHPVSTANRGIVWAKELKIGDRVLTDDGSVLITKIKQEQYKDNVYNLKLAPTAKSNIAEGTYLGMYANNMLVGDLDTQDVHNYKDQFIRETPEEKLQRLPLKWRADYISSLNEAE